MIAFKKRLLIVVSAAALMAMLAGCGDSRPPYPDGLVQLSEADRTAAIEQGVCPVCREQLGTKGTPVKAAAEGREVFACSTNCEQQLAAEPKKYLKALESISAE